MRQALSKKTVRKAVGSRYPMHAAYMKILWRLCYEKNAKAQLTLDTID